MSEHKSYPHLAYVTPGDGQMSAAIADELHAIVTRAAQPIRPGDSVKAQQNRAWLNLGRPALWRLRSAWWRDGSGSWSAAAVRDFQARFQNHIERERRRAEAIQNTPSDAAYVQLARADYMTLVERIGALEDALRLRT